MILQALNEYYVRKQNSRELAPEGFERKEIPFVIVLDANGHVLQIDDTRDGDGKKRQARSFLVPQAAKKSVNVAASLLWGNAEYVLDIPDSKKLEDNKKKGKESRYRERLKEMHRSFVALIESRFGGLDDAGIAAVLAFLSAPDMQRLGQEACWEEIETTNPNLTFRLSSDNPDMPVCARPAVIEALQASDVEDESGDESSFCLITGKDDRVQRLHPSIKGVWGAQTSGANIVSFNLPAFASYGKEQGANAPVGERAAFNYTTVLNHLLRKGSPQRIQVGDASTVFWASKKSTFVDSFAAMFGRPEADDPDRGVQAVRNLLDATRTGIYLPADKDIRFYVLGLAPNAARIAVRFWKEGPVSEFALNIARHFKDIEIDKPAFESGYLSLFRLLNSTALQNKAENVPPDLAGDTMRAILTGLPYPATLLQAAVRRCRAEQSIPHARAAVIKACLSRLIRARHFSAKEIDVTLDRSNTDPGYRLGRLFSALERIQSAAQPGINATIRDRYYGAASSSPSSVFPVLLRLKNHHTAKLDRALATWYEKLFGEIFSGIRDFPAHLSLHEQGLFAIGYYHQQQDFFAGKSKPADTSNHSTAGEQ
ncbi:MAG: type I-C CRISPR-associated protein Cas8c/Csd1 [Gammaproteobacteria bacterium]